MKIHNLCDVYFQPRRFKCPIVPSIARLFSAYASGKKIVYEVERPSLPHTIINDSLPLLDFYDSRITPGLSEFQSSPLVSPSDL